MIVTVTLNPAIDKTLEVPNFRPGRRHRSVSQATLPGGKGINVARAIKRLGRPVIATGFAGGTTGTHIVEALTREQVLADFVRIREESRTNTAVLDPTTSVQTEVNERGPAITERELEQLREKILYLAQGAAILVFAGSLPHDVPADVYATLVRDVRKHGVVTVIDTDGEPLRHAVRAEPTVVSPNLQEAEELLGHEFGDEEEDRVQAVVDLAGLGAREAILTVPDGCYAQVVEDGGVHRLYRVRIDEQDVRSPVGSGDAFLAGYVAARYEGAAPAECLRLGVACGAESTQHVGAGMVDPARVERLREEVQVSVVERPPAEVS